MCDLYLSLTEDISFRVDILQTSKWVAQRHWTYIINTKSLANILKNTWLTKIISLDIMNLKLNKFLGFMRFSIWIKIQIPNINQNYLYQTQLKHITHTVIPISNIHFSWLLILIGNKPNRFFMDFWILPITRIESLIGLKVCLILNCY